MTDNSWSDTSRFDSKASEWDANALRAALADAVARVIIAHMPVSRPKQALEFGCGTGLVTMRIAPHCDSLTAVDTSIEMLRVLNGKIETESLKHVRTCCLDLTLSDYELPKESFDLVYSSMTLHHIPDTALFLQKLQSFMCSGSTLAIADLDREDGLFHDDDTEKVHHGFERPELQSMLESAGFRNVAFITAHSIEKKNRAGRIATYPVFLVTAVKP